MHQSFVGKIGFATDHAGLDLRDYLKEQFESLGLNYADFGAQATDGSVDYPEYVAKMVSGLKTGVCQKGVPICGSGIGVSIAANKYPGIRAALVFNEAMAKLATEHNNAQIICLGARFLGKEQALACIKAWLNASFLGERHLKRLEKIETLANTNGKGLRADA